MMDTLKRSDYLKEKLKAIQRREREERKRSWEATKGEVSTLPNGEKKRHPEINIDDRSGGEMSRRLDAVVALLRAELSFMPWFAKDSAQYVLNVHLDDVDAFERKAQDILKQHALITKDRSERDCYDELAAVVLEEIAAAREHYASTVEDKKTRIALKKRGTSLYNRHMKYASYNHPGTRLLTGLDYLKQVREDLSKRLEDIDERIQDIEGE